MQRRLNLDNTQVSKKLNYAGFHVTKVFLYVICATETATHSQQFCAIILFLVQISAIIEHLLLFGKTLTSPLKFNLQESYSSFLAGDNLVAIAFF